jgi:hypothetical protein
LTLWWCFFIGKQLLEKKGSYFHTTLSLLIEGLISSCCADFFNGSILPLLQFMQPLMAFSGFRAGKRRPKECFE